MDADWLTGFQTRIADLQRKSEELQTRMTEERVTVSSPDDSVTVTVGLTGVLSDLRLGHRACDLGPARLTALIMQTFAQARGQAAHEAAAAFAPLGAGTDAMRMVNMHLPEDGQDEPAPAPPAAPQAQPQQPTPPQQPRRPAPPDEDDDVELW